MLQGIAQDNSHTRSCHGLRRFCRFTTARLIARVATSSFPKNQTCYPALSVGPESNFLQPALSSSFGEGIRGCRYA
jgi:hypothetical protein